MPFPFELPYEELKAQLDGCVDAVFGALDSVFLDMPKGGGFVEYPVFEQGYEALKRTTGGFRSLSPDQVFETVCQMPIALIVLRAMLGLTPPEWAYLATQRTSTEVTQGAVRSLDRRIRMAPLVPLSRNGGINKARLRALIATACELLAAGAPPEVPGVVHRMDKADTKHGLASLQPMAALGVPYAMLLYERFLGRPFASHKDSISELVGDIVETAIEAALSEAGVSFRKTKRAERVAGFDQAPDFIVPDEFNPQVVIEAKITEDDGTARDKVTRVQHLGALSMQGRTALEPPRFEVVACIAGRGFKVRREDMRKLLLATRGKVFTLQNLPELVANTRLQEFRTR
jgi:hypothetical protein